MDGIDFDLYRGEAFGFLGPNGAGKSSTMRMIGCVSPPTSGELVILGRDPVRDGSAADRDTLGEAEALAEGLQGTGDESTRSGERRRRRHRSTRYRIAHPRPRWLLPLIVMVLVVIVVLWYLLRRVNEVPQGRIILEGAVWDDTSAPSRRPPASPG